MCATCIADFTAFSDLKWWHLTMKKNFFILRTLCFLCSFEHLWATFVERLFCTQYFTEIVPIKSINPGVLLSPRFTFLVCHICYLDSFQKFTLPLASRYHTYGFPSPFLPAPSQSSPPLSVESSRVWLWPLALVTLLTFPKPVSEQQQQKNANVFLNFHFSFPMIKRFMKFYVF